MAAIEDKINTNNYEFRPINGVCSYLFEIGKAKARISYISNGDSAGIETTYEATETQWASGIDTDAKKKDELLVSLGMVMGKDDALEKIREGFSDIEKSLE